MASLADELAAASCFGQDDENNPNVSNVSVTEASSPKPPSISTVDCWSEICDAFDPDQETKNFGTRHAFEAVGNVFDVFTLATLQPKVSL